VERLDSQRLGEHLEGARRRALLSRAQLARRLGVSEESVRRWENGGSRPSPERLAQLIAVLAIDGTTFSVLPRVATDLPPISRRLRDERAQRGITQAQASFLLGVAQPTYAGWEIGRASPRIQHLGEIACFLGVSLEDAYTLTRTRFTVPTDNWPEFGRILGRRREALCLTREGLAAVLGVSPATVAAWELGYRTPRTHQLSSLADALGLPVDELAPFLPQRDAQLAALGRLIRSRQQLLGLRLRDLAERTGVDEATLSRWVHGHHAPAADSLRRLAAALELPFATVDRVAQGMA
jgi:transcriptional regulator with XRE-family HTH domain